MLVYVDDIIMPGNDTEYMEGLIHQLSIKFATKDLRQLHYSLDIEVLHAPINISILHSKYAKDLLHKVRILEASHLSTPAVATNTEPQMTMMLSIKRNIKTSWDPFNI